MDEKDQLLDALEAMEKEMTAAVELLRDLPMEELLLEPAHDALTQLYNGLDAEAGQVAQALELLPDVCTRTASAANEVQAAIVEASTRVERAVSGLTERVEEVAQLHGEAKGTADAALETMNEKVDEITEELDDLIDETKESIVELLEMMVEGLTENLLTPVTEFREECVGKIEALIAEVVDEILPDKLEEVTSEWLAELREELVKMIDRMQEGFGEFRETIFQGTDEAGASRATSETAMELLRTAFAPVLNELTRVRSLAGTVGISI